MFARERHEAIKRIVNERGRLNFAELQALVDVSPATLRRDLTDLESSGDVIRVHGGVLAPAYLRAESSFDERVLHNRPAKRRIGAAAAALVPAGATVFVDAGTTCLEAGIVLLGREDVRLITHSVALLGAALQGRAEVLALGGQLRKVSGALVGSAALGCFGKLRADFGFLGASGLDAEGCSTTEVFEAEMKKAILSHTGRKILLADHAKWMKPSTVRFAEWGDIGEWITDRKPGPKELKMLRAKGVEVREPGG